MNIKKKNELEHSSRPSVQVDTLFRLLRDMQADEDTDSASGWAKMEKLLEEEEVGLPALKR